jgi:glycine/D-amino acid oxidase-like deaminating enzyme
MTQPRDKFPTDNHGWAELLPERRASAPLSGSRRVPWVVIGAGLTGLACARRLAQLHPADEILLLDARRVGQAASGRNSGFVVATSHFPHEIDCQWQREGFIHTAQWQREGFIHTAAGEAALREQQNFLQYLDTMEAEHEVLDQAALQQRLGTSHYRGGVHIADGALVQPAALVRGLADTLPANVSLHENSPVYKITEGKPLSLQLAGADLRADRVILATNFESVSLNFLRSRIVGSTLAGSFTRVLTRDELASLGSLTEWGAISLHSGGATLRLTRDHRISIRNTAEYHGSVLLTDEQLARRQVIHREAFERRFPQLAQVPFEYAWSGVEGISRNGTNFFGQQRRDIYLAGGYNGSGVSRGSAFGTAIADYASGEASQTVSDCLASAPARWMPPRPLLDLAAFFIVRSRFKGVGLDR